MPQLQNTDGDPIELQRLVFDIDSPLQKMMSTHFETGGHGDFHAGWIDADESDTDAS